MPPRAARAARLVSLGAVVAVLALLASDLPVVLPSAHVERSLGVLVPGVALVLRADPTGVTVAMLAARSPCRPRRAPAPPRRARRAAPLPHRRLPRRPRRQRRPPLRRARARQRRRPPPRRRRRPDRASRPPRPRPPAHRRSRPARRRPPAPERGGHHRPQRRARGADPWWDVGLPWALAGAVRLLGAAGLPSEPRPARELELDGGRGGADRADRAAAPRRGRGRRRAPPLLAGLMVAGGLAVGAGGAVEALRRHALPAAAGRALGVAAAGPVIVLSGVATQPARLGIAADRARPRPHPRGGARLGGGRGRGRPAAPPPGCAPRPRRRRWAAPGGGHDRADHGGRGGAAPGSARRRRGHRGRRHRAAHRRRRGRRRALGARRRAGG